MRTSGSRRWKRLALVAFGSALALAPLAPKVHAQSFTGIGFAPGASASFPLALSANGKVAVGDSSGSFAQAMRWTAATGVVVLGYLSGGFASEALGVNADGSVVVGYDGYGGECATGSEDRAFRWTSAGGLQFLGFPTGGNYSIAFAASADGSIIVGDAGAASCPGINHAALWIESSGWTQLGNLPGAVGSQAFSVSADGSVVAGQSCFSTNFTNNCVFPEAYRWTKATGMIGLGFLSGGNSSVAIHVSGDGTAIVGRSNDGSGRDQAFEWTAGTGMQGLGFLPNATNSQADAVSRNGAIVVGTSGGKAFRWSLGHGMQSIQDLLTAAGVDTTGWQLTAAVGISADGAVIGGQGVDPSGRSEGWIATLPVFAGVPGRANCIGKSISGLAKEYGGIAHAAAALSYGTVAELQNAVVAYCGG